MPLSAGVITCTSGDCNVAGGVPSTGGTVDVKTGVIGGTSVVVGCWVVSVCIALGVTVSVEDAVGEAGVVADGSSLDVGFGGVQVKLLTFANA